MLKKIFTNHFVIAGIILFFLLFFIGLFAVDLTLNESFLLASVISVVAIGAAWWNDLWPF